MMQAFARAMEHAPDSLPMPSLDMDQRLHATMARVTGGISPIAVGQACADWFLHLLLSPDKQAEMARKYGEKWERLLAYTAQVAVAKEAQPVITPLPQDYRFREPAWQKWPFNWWYQSFLLRQQWWHNAVTKVPGVSKHHEEVVAFIVRQLLDMASPSNFPLTNPTVLEHSVAQGGMNFVRGALNMWDDIRRNMAGERPAGMDAYKVGENIAITPGKVVYRNRLIELIQYSPTTGEVHPEPILIVPAWIMKYYILDLSPENSLIRYLVANGYTVFAISWKNPDKEDADLSLDDYRELGVMSALDVIGKIVPNAPVHGVGYCLGGTLLSISAAAMARDQDLRLKSVTLFAAQTDFTEAGELMLFIDADQVQFLEYMMAERGYLDSRQMAGAFQLLRSNDLIWSAIVHDYMMGERSPMSDLMAWNADATRMPYRMHSEYLRHLFLNNDLAEGRFLVDGRPVSLRDIRVPIFTVSTETDHVAPWRSVYKIQMFTDADVTFVLSNGGHNAGIVNPPGNSRRHYRVRNHQQRDVYVDPNTWQVDATQHDGSWWPCWLGWLDQHSSKPTAPPSMGAEKADLPILGDAPGAYVLKAA